MLICTEILWNFVHKAREGTYPIHIGGLEIMVGSEDPLQKKKKKNWAYLFKRGQVEHVSTMANLKLKPSLFTPRPNVGGVVNCFCQIIKMFREIHSNDHEVGSTELVEVYNPEVTSRAYYFLSHGNRMQHLPKHTLASRAQKQSSMCRKVFTDSEEWHHLFFLFLWLHPIHVLYWLRSFYFPDLTIYHQVIFITIAIHVMCI